MPSLSRCPIIALAPTVWSGRRLGRQQVLSRLADRGWPVAYSNGALWMWQRNSPEWKQSSLAGLFRTSGKVEVYEPGRLLPRWPRVPAWDQLAIRHHSNQLLKAAGEPSICYLFHPAYWPYVRHLRPHHVIFHAYDSFDRMDGWTSTLEAFQAELARRADLLLVAARGMAESLPVDVRSRARELPNGADVELFSAAAVCPDDLAAIPHPRLGFAGALNAKLDLELVLEISRQRPEWHWVFVGKSYYDDRTASSSDDFRATTDFWQACRNRPNIHYLGEKPYSEIAAYVAHMDVGVLCYRSEGAGWWRQLYPLKLHEQLSVGKPVVGANIPVIQQFSHVVDVCSTPADWIAALERAISSGGVATPAGRRAVALQNTWDQRVDLLENWIFEMLSGKNRHSET
jgi:glycosyltransferase involved in cell wall biosynthesis